MGLNEFTRARADRIDGTSCQTEIDQVMGVGYGIGMDLGSRLLRLLENGDVEDLRPPIFAIEPRHDIGESAGFKAELGVAPSLPLEDVALVLKGRFGIETNFVEVDHEEQLTTKELGFMTGRLPAIRVCPVLPSITEAAVA